MINVIALAAEGENMTFADRATTAGIVSLQGMLTIFLVLAILWGAIEVLHYALVGRKEKKKSKPVQESAPAPAAAAAPAPVAPVAPTAPVADDGAIVAAITAAIAAQLSEEGYTGGFRVVSFKRAANAPRKRI